MCYCCYYFTIQATCFDVFTSFLHYIVQHNDRKEKEQQQNTRHYIKPRAGYTTCDRTNVKPLLSAVMIKFKIQYKYRNICLESLLKGSWPYTCTNSPLHLNFYSMYYFTSSVQHLRCSLWMIDITISTLKVQCMN